MPRRKIEHLRQKPKKLFKLYQRKVKVEEY